MGLLGDLYSTIDSKKRQLRGLLSDPVETLYQGVRNFGAEQQGLLDMQARAYPWTGTDRTAAPDLAARKALADAGAAQGMAAATVWHGSPHKFDKFDSSKIGTGEGAQAYGHGLYLAESPAVAGQYADTLGVVGAVDNGGNQIGKTGVVSLFSKALKEKGLSDAAALSQATQWADNFIAGKPVTHSIASGVVQKNGLKAAKDGSLYKVDLPDEHIAKMLDWDKPLRLQSPELQALAKQHGITDPNGEVGGVLGKGLYESIGDGKASAKTAEKLKALGIPGIRYLDGGSRSAGQGSSNFVVFPGNEGLLSILERNGAPIK